MSVYAQEYGYFFNSNNSDRKYNAESFETWLKPFFVSGVFTGGLQVSAQSTPDMSVQVSAGYANLDGKLGYWNESNTLTLETASGVYSRYDTIVLRRDNTNRRVSIEVVTGTASSNPQPTAPTRTADIFELVLAEILVVAGATEITASKIEDKRPDDTVCGYVVAAVQTPDFSELYAQFTAQAEEFMGEQAAEFLAWFDEMKDQLSEDAAGHLQNEIDDINNTIGDVPVGKDLQGEINDIESEINTLEDGLAIVVDGNKTAHVGGAAVGDYVLVKNSTITDILDGGYKAAKAIPANTVIDKTYLTACSNGIANSLSDQITNVETTTVNCPDASYDTTTNLIKINLTKIGKVCMMSIGSGRTKALAANALIGNIPEGYRPASFVNVWETSIPARFAIETNGNFHPTIAVASNSMVRTTVVYLTE